MNAALHSLISGRDGGDCVICGCVCVRKLFVYSNEFNAIKYQI